MSNVQKRFKGGMAILKAHRNGKGRWRRFPYYYTLLALVDIPGRLPLEEMRYVAPGLERLLKRSPREGMYDTRRRALAERILARI